MILLFFACDLSTPSGVSASAKEADTGLVPLETLTIPAGSFAMGCDPAADPDCDPDEQPIHTVTLSAYAIDRTEITVSQFQACVDAGGCTAVDVPQGPNFPVTQVTYEQAAGFCAWRDMGLPTEAQWERAARGADGRLYPWGNEAPDCDRVAQRACGGLQAVGQHPTGASPEGLLDMAGNAWEWVADSYSADYYSESPDTDPTGPTSRSLGTVRGIDMWSRPAALRASNRELTIPTAQGVLVGFRCAVEE